MSSFKLTNKAKNDLKTLATYSEERWNRAQRNIYLKQFDDTFHFLAKNPLAGKECDFVLPGYRKFPQGSHVIFYKLVSKNELLIIRILHKQMDINSQF